MCPYFMSLGMSYNEFWYSSPYLVKTYYNAHIYRQKIRNEEMWLQGLYNYNAFSSVMEMFAWSIGGGKGARPKGYIEKPLDITPKTESELREMAKKERAKAVMSLNKWLSAWKEQYGND